MAQLSIKPLLYFQFKIALLFWKLQSRGYKIGVSLSKNEINVWEKGNQHKSRPVISCVDNLRISCIHIQTKSEIWEGKSASKNIIQEIPMHYH